jgi:hypothetical protein
MAIVVLPKNQMIFLTRKKILHQKTFLSIQKNGFTLILTISLMVLLTMIAIGMLSLSTLSLRSSTQGNAAAVARANAKMAMMIAIGELQKTLGPDKAISATSEIVSAAPAKPNLTGAWSSWALDPSSATLNYSTEKNSRFRKWLVSDINPVATTLQNYASTGAITDPIELVANGTLGAGAVVADKVNAGRVPILLNGKKEGNFAWHVADESVKARINLYRDPGQSETLAKRRALLAGHRPDVKQITASDNTALDFLPQDDTAVNFATAKSLAPKLIDMNQFDVYANAKKIGKFRNSITPYSVGLLTDVRNGGLKQDLSSLFEMTTMPSVYNGQKLYQSTHKITGVSDPYWSALQGYYATYRDITNVDTNPTYYKPAQEAITTTTFTPPRRFYPAPVIAKVEVLFTYVTRDSHSGWVASLKAVDPDMTRMGHLVYVPLVTLHNPYNVNIQFEKMQVVIRNIPVAFNFYVNNVPQSSGLCSLNEMFVNDNQKGEKSFALDIANWSSPGSGTPSGVITMKPGQTLVCGPYLNPQASFSNTQGTPFFDWQNNLTGVDAAGNVTFPIPAKPGFAGKAVGFDVDWITPPQVSSGQSNDGNKGVFGLKDTDQVYMEYGIKQPTRGVNNQFEVAATITSGGRSMSYGGLNFQYNDQATLSKYFNKTYRYPASGTIGVQDTYASNTTPISAQGRAKAVALFSAYARTTNGGVFETNRRTVMAGALNVQRDGQLTGKPFLENNPARSVVSIDLANDAPAMHSHELNFQPLSGEVDDIFEIDTLSRSNYLTGNTTLRGVKSGSYLELPTGPMLTIADFRRSNALTSSYLPNFVQPVSNSTASALMSTNRVSETGIARYALLDHSVLANHALYDKFYFSTIAPYGSKAATLVLTDFMNSNQPLLSQAFTPYLPSGKVAADVAAELLTGGKPTPVAYQLAAEYQLVNGAFNVNSTSVQAWKAMLSSMFRSKMQILWAKSGALESKDSNYIPIAPMSLVNGGNATDVAINANAIDNVRTNQWNGYRELTPTEIDTLAKLIVDQVRLRGPFLSMSEFVNRQIGPDSALTRAGVLQTAINLSNVNNAVFTTQIPITAADVPNGNLYRNKTPSMLVGNPAEGAPGWIMQGDLMRILEPTATVRSDTFVIRTCGEATDAYGVVTARAYAEAVVQRVPEYVNPIDRPSVNVNDVASANAVNKAFGRRFKMVSFRWLAKQEI